MRRNAPDALRQEFDRRRLADIAEAEYADHALVLVDHRQPTDFQLLHVADRLGEVFVLAATMDFGCHHVAGSRAAGIELVLRQSFAYDVAVGHHADETIVLANRDSANVVLAHELRELGHRSLGTDPVDSLVHHIFDFHGGTSVA